MHIKKTFQNLMNIITIESFQQLIIFIRKVHKSLNKGDHWDKIHFHIVWMTAEINFDSRNKFQKIFLTEKYKELFLWMRINKILKLILHILKAGWIVM